MRAARAAAALAACMLLAAGCGTEGKESDVIAVSDEFHAALEERDGARACSRLTEETVETLEREEMSPCPEAILELDLPAGARASGADLYVTSAYADLPGSGAAFLDQGPAGWRISAAGCTPGRPERPFDCELGG
jgi:hypothetical protein